LIEQFINGLLAGAGMFVASAVFGYLFFRYSKPWLTKTISEMWVEIKKSGLEVEVRLDGKRKKK